MFKWSIAVVIAILESTAHAYRQDDSAIHDQASPALSFVETAPISLVSSEELQRQIAHQKEAKEATRQLLDKISAQSLSLKSEVDGQIESMRREKNKIDDALAKEGIKSGLASSFAQVGGIDAYIRRERDRVNELGRKWKTDADMLTARFNLESEQSVLNTPEIAALHDKVTEDDKRLQRLQKTMEEDLRKVRNDVALTKRFSKRRGNFDL